MNDVVPPVKTLWRSEDGRYHFYELVHPQHVQDVGEAFDQCLHACYVPTYKDRVPRRRTLETPDVLLQTQLLDFQQRRIFVMAVGETLLSFLVFAGNTVTDFYLVDGRQEYMNALAEALAEVCLALSPPGLQFTLPVFIPDKLSWALYRRFRLVPLSVIGESTAENC